MCSLGRVWSQFRGLTQAIDSDVFGTKIEGSKPHILGGPRPYTRRKDKTNPKTLCQGHELVKGMVGPLYAGGVACLPAVHTRKTLKDDGSVVCESAISGCEGEEGASQSGMRIPRAC